MTRLAATFSVLMMLVTGTIAATMDPVVFGSPRSTINALSVAVDAVVAGARPQHWPMKRACLYYAIAGQALLAEVGIPARLRVGQVVYWPGTAAAHLIAPHAWLETVTHFVDYAMLPRTGGIAIIPRQRVAAVSSAVVPDFTLVLASPAELDRPLRRYLSHHHRRFYSRRVADSHRQSALPISPARLHRAGPRQFKPSSDYRDREAYGIGNGQQTCRRTVP